VTELPLKIIILAGGPEFQRPRHLKKLWWRLARVIDIPIRESLKVTKDVYVLIDSSNTKVVEYVKRSYPGLKILFPDGPLMMDTFNKAFTFDGFESEKVVIAGDLVDINSQDISLFCKRKGYSALPLLPKPFKNYEYIQSKLGEGRLRTDVGQGMFRVTPVLQRLFFEGPIVSLMMTLRSEFKGTAVAEETSAKDVWTWMLYLLFDQIYLHKHLLDISVDSGAQVLVPIKSDTSNDYDKQN
jgi:hypothetical protein